MIRYSTIALPVLLLALLLGPDNIIAAVQGQPLQPSTYALRKRADEGYGTDSYKVYNRLRNGHACIMSIVFIILYPLGAIAVHLPIDKISFLRNTYLRNKIPSIHVPIQVLATVMMVGAMALGIRLAQDTDRLSGSVPAHVIIGLVVVAVIVLVQPAMGILQHRHFKRTGGKSVFAYVHRWVGRLSILLGIINNGLGFQLAMEDNVIPTGSIIRNFVIVGVLLLIWVGLAAYDEIRFKHQHEKGVSVPAEGKHLDTVDGPVVDGHHTAAA
ncbi:hypothetical protein BT63DRAFT_477849 [Microthyrium microscopicum]|uniref:Cytochrome b561 domain-containing protein n=1 Tax=Microthyrium microscopicum TaxID=703497 RepID=A0A6A6UIR4_9PEZI|nr:hypothetical protein BT63DRAFT_477849 [Microthyrium microscopicum]